MNELLQDGKYRINNQLDSSENTCIYEAFDTVNNRNVVIKEIPLKLNKVTTYSQQESMRLAFANEAKALKEIKHDSLVRVLDFFTEIGRQYLVLETIEGRDLAEAVAESGAFSYTEVSHWADQLLDALTHLHQLKPAVTHRAIKPKNLKLGANGQIKLVAYSMSDGNSNLDVATDPKDTALNYSPLEIIWESLDSASQNVISNSYDEKSETLLKQGPDARSDVFGLAATLYYLLTCKKPVDALERSIELLEGKRDPLSAPHVVDPSIPIEVSNVIMRALEIRRENRFDSASMMRQALKTSLVLIKEREAAGELKHNDERLEQNIAEHREASVQPNGFENTSNVFENVVEVVPQVESREPIFAKMEYSEADAMKQQLREAEAQRKLAEERASEAERLLRERDLALNPLVRAETKLRPEPDAYIPSAFETNAASNVLSAETLEEKPQIEPDEFMPRLEVSEPEPTLETFAAPTKTLHQHISSSPETASAASVLELSYADSNPLESLSDPISLSNVIDSPFSDEAVSSYEERPIASRTESKYDPSSYSSSYAENSGSGFSFSMPMIAGIAAVIVVAVIGVWFLLPGGSSENVVVPEPVATQPENPVVEQQAVAEPETAVTTEPEAATEADQAVIEPTVDVPVETQASTRTQPVRQTAKPKQNTSPAVVSGPSLPPPPKTQTAKKKLTVDDLLKDN